MTDFKVIDKKELLEKGIPKEGISAMHVKIFTHVAKQFNVVIATRTPGEACLTLIKEGYDCKSFHVKAKSCTWGPMRGFVCVDPFLNKNGKKGAEDNLKSNQHSLCDVYEDNKTSQAVQIKISQTRFDELKPFFEDFKEYPTYATGKSIKEGVEVNFILIKETIGKNQVWAVYYDLKKIYGLDKTELIEINEKTSEAVFTKAWNAYFEKIKESTVSLIDAKIKQQEKIKKDPSIKEDLIVLEMELKKIEVRFKAFFRFVFTKYYTGKYPALDTVKELDCKHYLPLLAMTNVHLNNSGDNSYLNAITGDYDLFCVWPTAKEFGEDDKRIGGMTQNISNKQIIDKESANKLGKLYGNISQRVYNIVQNLNSYFTNPTEIPILAKDHEAINSKEAKVNRLFHSDEAGRPFIDNPDAAAYFTPWEDVYMIDNNDSFDKMVGLVGQKGYGVVINKGWEVAISQANQQYIKWAETIS